MVYEYHTLIFAVYEMTDLLFYVILKQLLHTRIIFLYFFFYAWQWSSSEPVSDVMLHLWLTGPEYKGINVWGERSHLGADFLFYSIKHTFFF